MEVLMPVTCVSKKCADCPELELEIDRNIITSHSIDVDDPLSDDAIMAESRNYIRCVHAARCKRLMNTFLERVSRMEAKKNESERSENSDARP